MDFSSASPAAAVLEVERLLLGGKAFSTDADEVWPKLYISGIHIGENFAELQRRQFTHVLNCAHNFINNSQDYEDMGITYMGIEAHDTLTFDMSAHFNTATEFIHTALEGGGKILVHCQVGVSRSATIVLAYLMLKHNMTLVDAINTVKDKRSVMPNPGFLGQLIDLHVKLHGYNK